MEKLFCLVIVSLLTNYVSGTADRIAGGKHVTIEEIPYFVQIMTLTMTAVGDGYYSIEKGNCGGSLIHSQWVLTAAHCFKTNHMRPLEDFDWVRAYMGTEKVVGKVELNHLNDTTLPFRTIQQVYIHDHYTYTEIGESQEGTNDVAVALLEQPFLLNKYIKTIRLPSINEHVCSLGTIVGGGMVDFNGAFGSFLKYAEVHSKTVEQISVKRNHPSSTVFYTEVKFYEGHPLQGDSGGPFVCADRIGPVQYGIISAGYNSSIPTAIDEYEMVTKHLWFIKKYVRLDSHHIQWRSKRKRPQTARNQCGENHPLSFGVLVLFFISSTYSLSYLTVM